MIETAIGPALISSHVYNDRMDRHALNEEYIESLLTDTDGVKRAGLRRLSVTKERDGVLWEIILEEEDDERLDHEWDIVTVIPKEVDLETAEQSDQFCEAEALNLALYSN